MTLDELFSAREAELRAEHQEREAAEALRRDSLTPEEREQEDAARIARMEELYGGEQELPDEGEEEEDDWEECEWCGNQYDPVFGCQHCARELEDDED